MPADQRANELALRANTRQRRFGRPSREAHDAFRMNRFIQFWESRIFRFPFPKVAGS
jgi:hypothetical protein